MNEPLDTLVLDRGVVEEKIVKLLEPCRVEVPVGLRTGKRTRRSFNGKCYQKALEYLISHIDVPEIRLVHGELDLKMRVSHAWIELPGEMIFDGIFQRFYRKSCYYYHLKAIALDSYSPSKALGLWTRHRHYGPWP